MTIEDDIERVQRATDKLVGPQKVWVLINDDENGMHTSVYISETIARESWKNILTNYVSDPLLLDALIVQIDAGECGFEVGSDSMDFWSLEACEVESEPFK
jgi:hypothetical protein